MIEKEIIKQEKLPEYYADTLNTLKLDDGKLKSLGEECADRFSSIRSHRERSQWEREKAEAFEAYHMMEKIKDLPYPGYPNLTSVLPRIGVDSFHANVMQSIFGNGFRELVAPRYISPQYMAKAKKAAAFLSYQLEQECDFYRVMDDADLKAQIYGIAYIEPYYVKEYEYETSKYKITKQVPTTDPMTGQMAVKESTLVETKKKRKTIFDGIKMDSLPVDSIFVSPYIRNLKIAAKDDKVFKRFTLTWNAIKSRAHADPETKQSFYIPEQVDMLAGHVTQKYADGWDELTRKRAQYDGFYLNELLAPKQIELVEAYYWTDIDNDGIQEEVIVTFHPDSKTVVRVAFGKCRIVELKPRPVDERFNGEGIPKICKWFDLEWESIHNARVAAGQWENTTFGFYRAGGRFNPSEITIMPGHFYPVDNPSDTVFAQTPSVRPSYFQEEQLLFNYFERIFGLSENLQGVVSARARTATEDISVSNKAMVRFANPFTREILAIEDLIGHMWDLNRSCAPEDKEYFVSGIGATPLFGKMTKGDYDIQLDFKLNVNTVFDQQLTRDTALLVYNTLFQNPLVQMNPGAMYDLVDQLLQAVNFKLKLPMPPEAKLISPMEEHDMMLEGQHPDPQPGEDIDEHLKYHMAMLTEDSIKEWSSQQLQALMLHIDKTKILQQTLRQFQLNQSGKFEGMPSPMANGAKQPGLTLSRNPSDMMNRMRTTQTGPTQVNNSQMAPVQPGGGQQ